MFSVTFTADGKYICAGGERGVVYSFPFKHMQTVLTLDFSKDGEQMASGDRGGETIVWNLWTGEPYRRFQPDKEAVNWVRFHPDGNRLATAMHDGKVRVWDVKANKMLYEIAAHEGESNSVAFSPDGKWLATGGKDKKIKLWNAADGKPVAVLEGHGDAVNVVVFRPKGVLLLASGSDDKTARVWDQASRKTVQTLSHEKAVYGLSWRADGGMLATGAGKLVQLFEAK